MRLRNIPEAREAIQTSCFVIHHPEQYRGCWYSLFGSEAPLHIEVGMGKGRFLMELAAEHPEIHYLGIERYDSVLYRAVQKREAQDGPDNAFFISADALRLPELFGSGEISRIYLNFSDPWPKARHAKRRLTSREFLARYEQILEDGGTIEFKTDNQELFTFSLEEAEAAGWEIMACTRDLHRDPALREGNIMTEYEERFSSMGNPICKMILRLAR